MEDQYAGVVRFEVRDEGETRGRQAREAAAELERDLAKYLPEDVLATPKSATAEGEVGDKGEPVTLALIALAVIQSGVVTEVVRCIRDWLKRKPERRSVTIRRADGEEITVDATNVDDGSLSKAIEAAAEAAPA